MRSVLITVQLLFVLSVAFIAERWMPMEFSRTIKGGVALWSFGVLFVLCRESWHTLGTERPLLVLLQSFKRDRRIYGRALVIALVVAFSTSLHSWGKSVIPQVTTMWADPLLADFDHWLFGMDPWLLFRVDWLTPIYATLYVAWFPMTFGLLGVLAFSRSEHPGLINGFLGTWIVGGTIGQYALPSGGPMFYERLGHGDRFSELVATNHVNFTSVADYLWLHFSQGNATVGTGISAMPSMHVALAVWTVFAVRRICPLLTAPAIAYAVLIYCASISSGWHYATDGVVGAIVAAAVTFFCLRWEQSPGDASPASRTAPRFGLRPAWQFRPVRG